MKAQPSANLPWSRRRQLRRGGEPRTKDEVRAVRDYVAWLDGKGLFFQSASVAVGMFLGALLFGEVALALGMAVIAFAVTFLLTRLTRDRMRGRLAAKRTEADL